MGSFWQRKYSDAEVVQAFRSAESDCRGENKRICKFWYNKCRDVFGKGTSNYGNLPEYHKDDLFQESLIILWSKIDNDQIFVKEGSVYYNGKNGVNEVYDLSGYFMRIVKNKFLELLRSNTLVLELDEGVIKDVEKSKMDIYYDEDPDTEKMNIITSCIMKMPRSCQDILTAIYFEHKSLMQVFEERAQNESYMGLKSRKSKCISRLRASVNESIERRRWQR